MCGVRWRVPERHDTNYTGDICNPDNILDFATRVLQETHEGGVDLVVADGVS